jgi:hypothetical protein
VTTKNLPGLSMLLINLKKIIYSKFELAITGKYGGAGIKPTQNSSIKILGMS